MALEENRKYIFEDSLLIENLQLVRQISGFYPLTDRELFEAAAISTPDRPVQGAAEHVEEASRYQVTHGYASPRSRNVGASLVREYARYFRSSRTLLGEVNDLQEEGVRVLKTVDAPLLVGARAVVQFADLAAYQRGEEVEANPLYVRYRSHRPEINSYIRDRIKETPTPVLVRQTAETAGHLAAREAFWGRALADIHAHIEPLQPHVENVFRFSPLIRR